MSEERQGGFRNGIRQGLGVLSAFKEAIEETLQEAKDRGDLSPDRAREIMKGALDRVQEATESARDRFDFVTHGEMEALKARVDELSRRLDDALGLGDRPTPSGTTDGEASVDDGAGAAEAGPG